MTQRNMMWIGAGLMAAGAVVVLMGPGRAPMKRVGQKARQAGGRLGESMHGVRDRLGESMQGVRGRVGEIGERARHALKRERPAVAEDDLEERVEGAISRHISRPDAIQVDCQVGGDCVVSGEVRPQELSTVARTVQSIPGVQSVKTEVRESGGADPHPGPHLA